MARRRPARSTLLLRWLGLLVLLAIALAYVHPLRSYREARAEVAERHAEIARLEEERRELRQRLAFAAQDEFVEREARKLGLVRPGERLFIVRGVGSGEGARLP